MSDLTLPQDYLKHPIDYPQRIKELDLPLFTQRFLFLPSTLTPYPYLPFISGKTAAPTEST